MSLVELSELEKLGISWNANVWMKSDSTAKAKEILGQVNETLQGYRPNTYKVYTVFQKYDPYVRTAGLKSGSYQTIVEWAGSQKDGGVAAATEVLECLGDKKLKDLSIHMAALVVIVCFAEVGRGYKSELINFFLWIKSIKNSDKASTAKTLWASVNQSFAPSLTYKADQADFQPDF
jgi:hypothetical protein